MSPLASIGPLRHRGVPNSVALMASLILAGCAGGDTSQPSATTSRASSPSETNSSSSETKKPSASKGANGSASDAPGEATRTAGAQRKRFAPVQLGDAGAAPTTTTVVADEQRQEDVIAALQPLQILLGKWKATTRKALLDEPEWVWDLTTEPGQPALVLSSGKGAYLREARLTYSPANAEYTLTTKDAEGLQRRYQGTFSEPVQDVAGDDKQVHRSYQLELTETEPAVENEVWRIVLAQQDNNRYLINFDRQRGEGTFVRIDTVNTLREGTSFAMLENDYGDKECIISQGQGTIQVSYEGRNYWVCCTGCAAAFNDDPKRWLARLAEREQQKMKAAGTTTTN